MIARNLAAQAYSQLVTVFVQVGTVPFLVMAWGVDRFGVWLLLSAIPAYLSLADFGFTFIAKNDMSMRVARGDRIGALVTYQSVFVLLSIGCVIFALALASAVMMSPIDLWFNLGPESLEGVRTVLLLQFGSVLIYQFFLLSCSGLRCEGMAATEASLAATGRFSEAILIVVIALMGGGLVAAACSAFIVRLVFMLGAFLLLNRKAPWLQLGLSSFEWQRLRDLAGPSFSYMLVPISNALMIQAPLVVLGGLASPAVVALFGVTRTVARLGMSGANMLVYAFTPEYSYAAGAKQIGRFNIALRRHFVMFLFGLVLYLAICISFGGGAVKLISGGKIEPAMILTLLLVAGVSLEMLWNSLFAPLVALNRHRRLPLFMACAAVIATSTSLIFPDPEGIAVMILIAQFGIFLLVMREFLQSRGTWLDIRDGI